MNTDKIYAESIANQYAVKDATKVVQLRKLDQKAKLPADVFTYIYGILSTLLLGIGMCLCMKVIGSGTTAMTAIGVVVGVVGIAGMSTNYPIYKKILEKGKNKYGSDIIRLAKEITDEESAD